MVRVSTKLILTLLGLPILLAGLFFMVRPIYWTALTKTKDHFIENKINTKIYFEPNANGYSDKIAAYFPMALQIVDEKQLKTFPKPFNVYVCNSQKSHNEYLGENSKFPIRGTALRGDVYIAPSAFNFEGLDTHKETLKHELSHLLFRQQLGFFKYRKIPPWFHEGFSDYLAGSGGEGINKKDAINYILSGRHFIVQEQGKIFGSYKKAMNGISYRMFHKQAKMFVTYIAKSDSLGFNSFLQEIQEGKNFRKSFNENMNVGVPEMWNKFTSQLEG